MIRDDLSSGKSGISEEVQAAIHREFDPATLEELVRMDRDTPGLLARLATLFLDGTPALIARVSGASDDSAQDAERAAHSLKSTSARFGARTLAQLAAQAEAAVHDGQLGTARELGEAMRQEFPRVAEHVRQHAALSSASADA